MYVIKIYKEIIKEIIKGEVNDIIFETFFNFF
jgi:hypothetical protein